MTAMYKPNIFGTNRWTSVVAGAALAAMGYRRSNRALELLGVGLLARGASGWCPATAAMNRQRHEFDEPTKRYLGGPGGVIVEESITIYRPVSEVYSYWRNLENLPRFMEHLEEVRALDRSHSHWVAKGPLGVRVEWDAEIINDVPPTLLSWKSVGEPDVISAGSVRFKAVGERATEVRLKLQYEPPAGKVGATLAWMLGEDPERHISEGLRRFKQLLETGEVPPAGAYRAASSTERRDFNSSDYAGDFGSLR